MSFRELAQAEQASRLEDLARRALGAWSLEGAELELIKYRENAVFAVRARSGERFVMRVHRPGYRSDEEIRSEGAWMAALDKAGIRTPEVVPTRTGDVLTHADAQGVPESRQCDLLLFIDGDQLGTLEGGVEGELGAVGSVYEMVGELAARVHDHGVRWQAPSGFVRPSWDQEALVGEAPAFGRFWELDCLSSEQCKLLFTARDEARRRLDAFGYAEDRYGLLHGDLLPENVLLGEGGPRLIDFDDCGPGWYGFELATGLFPLHAQPSFEVALHAYVEGYRAHRVFPEEQLAMLPTFLMARSLSYLGWPVGRPEMEEATQIAPFLAEMTVRIAERYLGDDPIGAI